MQESEIPWREPPQGFTLDLPAKINKKKMYIACVKHCLLLQESEIPWREPPQGFTLDLAAFPDIVSKLTAPGNSKQV